MPDGVPAKGKRVAIYQCAEDGIADTIKPRLQQAGADCERVAYIIDNDIALTLEDGRIETAIKDTHASVFIIDPIQAFIPPDAQRKKHSLRSCAVLFSTITAVNVNGKLSSDLGAEIGARRKSKSMSICRS